MYPQILDIYSGNKFDARAEKDKGTAGVIIKMGQGSYPEYFANKCHYIDDCEKVGLAWGTYWLVDARCSPEAHKATLKQYLPSGTFGELGLWLDCEKPTLSTTDQDYMKMPYAYYKPIESIWRGVYSYAGVYPGIYTSLGFWNLAFGRMPLSLQQEFAEKCNLWTAQYGISSYKLYGQWKTALMWQYQGEPDYSNYYGDLITISEPSPKTVIDVVVNYNNNISLTYQNPKSIIIDGVIIL